MNQNFLASTFPTFISVFGQGESVLEAQHGIHGLPLAFRLWEIRLSQDRNEMKTYSKLFATAVLLATLSRGFGQGTFQNLNFESPVLPLTPDGFSQVPIANAIPGWQGYIGINQVSTITYNTISIGAAAITLQGRRVFESMTSAAV
jgi:hypothetical protein